MLLITGSFVERGLVKCIANRNTCQTRAPRAKPRAESVGPGEELGTANIVDWTMQHRTVKNGFGYKCWTQDQIHWAYAGNAAEASEGLVQRFTNASARCRFPLYGSEGPDALQPDVWQHVAVVLSRGRIDVYLDGKKLHRR